MDVTDFVQLFAYVADSRRQFLSRFRDLGWGEVTRNREATHHSMRNILVHMLDVEDSYVQEAIQGKPVRELNPEDFGTLEDLEAHDRELAARTETFLGPLTLDGLHEAVSVKWWKSKKRYNVEQILLHAFLDEIAHIGELIALMWQLDEEPPWASIVRTWVSRPPPSAE